MCYGGSCFDDHDTNVSRRCSYSRSRPPATRSYSRSSAQRPGASARRWCRDLSIHVQTVSRFARSNQSQHHWEPEHDRKMQLRAGLPEAAFHHIRSEAPALADKDNGMLMGMSLLQPNDRQTFLEPETPISDEVLLSQQHRRIRQKTMHGSDDMSLSTISS